MAKKLTDEQQKDNPERDNLNIREERFCLALVNTGSKYEAFDIAEYQAKTHGAKAAAVSRLLKRPKIRFRIDVLQKEYMLAKGITDERILGNLADIAFNKDNHNVDRTRALQLLGSQRAMWTDVTKDITEQQRELTASEEVLAKKIVAFTLAEAG